MMLCNMPAAYVGIRHKAKGPNIAVVTACASSTNSIAEALYSIRRNETDIILAGGGEAAITPMGIGGFASLKALSSRNDDPAHASRPFDVDRDGFVMGEGAGVVVLEEYEHAKKRGAKIYGEVVGYAMTGDAHHITAPGGNGGLRAMKLALKQAGMNPGDVDYINAHGTSTPMGDMVELNAVRSVFGNNGTYSMSSTKSAIGHLLGAAGAVEAIYCMMAMQNNIVPPTLNLIDPEEGTEGIDLVPLTAKERKVDIALSNSFGFGGTNGSLVFKKVK
jgi:3-oxoacyl-[acyl-carrier-protein] synthase II